MQQGRVYLLRLIDISRLKELRYIRQEDGRIRIGPLTTHADLERSSLLWRCGRALVEAASEVACQQVRNRGTLGGNIGTASPAADTVPALVALGAEVTLCGRDGSRTLAMEDVMQGPGKTALRDDEFIAEISFPAPPPGCGLSFLKVGRRNAMAISVVNVAVGLTLRDGLIADVRVAVGAVAPTVVRAFAVEDVLLWQEPSAPLLATASEAVATEISPISDVRASAAYRRLVTPLMVRRALELSWERAQRSSH